MRGFHAVVAAIACAVGLSAYGQTVSSYSIDGPATIDAASQLNATYSVTAHWSDGTTSTVTAQAPMTSLNPSVLVATSSAPWQPSATFVPVSIGTATLSFTMLDGTTLTRTVSVGMGAGSSDALSMDCASEDPGPWQQYYPSRLVMPPATDILPLCATQVLVSSGSSKPPSFYRVFAVDLATGRILRNFMLRAAARTMVRVAGTALVAVALEDASVALIDTSTNQVRYISVGRAGTVASFEPGQVVAVSDAYGASPSNVDATVIDVGSGTAHAPINLALPVGMYGSQSIFRYDPAHHAFVLAQAQAVIFANGTYDVASGQMHIGVSAMAGSEVFDLALSPDGQHVVTGGGIGNDVMDPGGPDAATDYAVSDLATPAGHFRFEFSGVHGIDFRSDGAKFLGSNGGSNFLFDATSHRVETAWLPAPPPAAGSDPCQYGTPSRLRASPRGRYVSYLRGCTSTYLYSALDWSQVLAASDPLPPPLPGNGVTIDGSSTLSVTDGTASYVLTRHNPDGTTTVIGQPHSASSQVLRWAGDHFVITGTGTVVMYDSFSGAQAFVRVTDVPAPTDPIALDCADDPVDAALPAAGTKMVVPLASDVLPLCGTQLVVANAAMNRIDVRDVGSNPRVLRSWPLAAAPLKMLRVPGTSFLVAALDNWTLARIDMSTGDIRTVAEPHGAAMLAALEAGQVLIYSTDEQAGAISATAAYASVVDVNAMTLRQTVWPLSPIVHDYVAAGHYDAAQHRLYFQPGANAPFYKLAYDPVSATFTPLANSLGANLTGATSFGPDFALAPDGTHFAATANYAPAPVPMSVYDISTSNMVDTVGTFGRAVEGGPLDFRFDGAQLLGAKLDALVAFDAASHVSLGGWHVDINYCQGPQAVRWSPHGRYVIARINCMPGATQLYIFSASSIVPPVSTTLALATAGSALAPNGAVSVSFNVTLSSTGGVSTPTGGFTLFDGSVALGACGTAPSAGCQFALGYGSHALHAQYAGDALFLPSTSNVVNMTVPAPVSVSLTSQQNPMAVNQSTVFTALLSSPAGVPTGTVSFFADSSPIAGCTNVPVTGPGTLASTMGTAQCPWASNVVGAHAITANYSGDSSYLPGSAQLTQTVLLSLNESNWALAFNGGVASASSQLGTDYPVRAVNDGDTLGANWTHGGGWADGTITQWPDIVQVDFNGPKLIDRVVLYTVQDNWQNPSPVTDTMTFTQLGITAFDVQGWDGANWQTLTSVSGNNLVKRTVTFTPFKTTKIRVVVNGSLYYVSRVVELEAWGVPGDAVETNWALAYYGGTASASSQLGPDFPVSSINDGETSGRNWTQGGGWADGTLSQWPDWVEIDYPVARTVDRVVVYTVQDNYSNPVQPTDSTTFTQYGITDFNVQAWNGTQWVTLGTVSGNRLVKSTVTFAPISTTKIRVNVTGGLYYVSRITEVETWGTNAPPPPAGETNVALAANGGFASASSQLSGDFPIGAINDGERAGVNWTHGGGWADGTVSQWPDWVQIDFKGAQTIDRVVVYTVQDFYQNAVEPTDSMTFGSYGITDFLVQGWNGTQWVTLATVSNNNLVKRTVTFTPFTTTRIRVTVTGSLYYVSRITEVEAWGVPAGPAPTNVALASAGAVATASSQLSPQTSDFAPSGMNDGDTVGANWTHGGGWADGTLSQWPDWAQIDFNGAQTINRVVVYTVQDNYANPVQPTDTTTFTQYGITDFQVQAWDGTQWVTLATVTGNNLVKRTVVFDPYTTTKMRVLVTNGLYYVSRIVEIEAWGTPYATAQSCPTASGFAPVDFTLPDLNNMTSLILASGATGSGVLGVIPATLGSERIQVAMETQSPVSGTYEVTISPCHGVIDPAAGACYMIFNNSPSIASIEWTGGVVPSGYPACHVDTSKTNYVNIRYNYTTCPWGSCGYAINVAPGSLPPP